MSCLKTLPQQYTALYIYLSHQKNEDNATAR
jgi:hypothetical protein